MKTGRVGGVSRQHLCLVAYRGGEEETLEKKFQLLLPDLLIFFSPANEKEDSILLKTKTVSKNIGVPMNGSHGPKTRGMKHRSKHVYNFCYSRRKGEFFLEKQTKTKTKHPIN